jgi:hypothetical protein
MQLPTFWQHERPGGPAVIPFSGKARKKKPIIRKVATNNEIRFLKVILHTPLINIRTNWLTEFITG